MGVVRSKQGDKVVDVLFRHLNSDDDELEQGCFELNPGLAHYGTVLPAGVEVVLPGISPAEKDKVLNVWD